MKSSIILLVSSLLWVACGSGEKDEVGSEYQSAEEATAGGNHLKFSGYVGGVFEIEVDGVVYPDLESFYTRELETLPGKLKDAGYEDYDFRLDAEIGFDDLWSGMTVYISPTENRGYQGRSSVKRDGSFSISLPPDAIDQSYKIRGNKRINLILTKGKQHKVICFNFSAVEKSVPFAEYERPIVMSGFVTMLTAYACSSDAGTGISVPEASAKEDYGRISKGMTKAVVLEALGDRRIAPQIAATNWEPPAQRAKGVLVDSVDGLVAALKEKGLV